eukprot:15448734-Alexandrium_andersonii.AAC.1
MTPLVHRTASALARTARAPRGAPYLSKGARVTFAPAARRAGQRPQLLTAPSNCEPTCEQGATPQAPRINIVRPPE